MLPGATRRPCCSPCWCRPVLPTYGCGCASNACQPPRPCWSSPRFPSFLFSLSHPCLPFSSSSQQPPGIIRAILQLQSGPLPGMVNTLHWEVPTAGSREDLHVTLQRCTWTEMPLFLEGKRVAWATAATPAQAFLGLASVYSGIPSVPSSLGKVCLGLPPPFAST
jgi:hypothetical protein